MHDYKYLTVSLDKRNGNLHGITTELFIHSPEYKAGHLIYRDHKVGRCHINVDDNVWTISAWYVDKAFQNQGYGRYILFKTCEELLIQSSYPIPEDIQYNWNGQNSYVFDWLSKNFNPSSMCPIAVLKYADMYPEDIPEGHLYKLDKQLFLNYMKDYKEKNKKLFNSINIEIQEDKPVYNYKASEMTKEQVKNAVKEDLTR